MLCIINNWYSWSKVDKKKKKKVFENGAMEITEKKQLCSLSSIFVLAACLFFSYEEWILLKKGYLKNVESIQEKALTKYWSPIDIVFNTPFICIFTDSK